MPPSFLRSQAWSVWKNGAHLTYRGRMGSEAGQGMDGSGGPDRPNELLDAYMAKRDDLVRFFAARLRSMTAAEDLVQDLYIRVASLEVAERVENPSAYLYRLASNLMLDRLRSDRRSGARDSAWVQEQR